MTLAGALALSIGIAIVVGVFVWWLIFRTEGVYLGTRVVVWLYDIYAQRYDSIKNFDPDFESELVAAPLLHILSEVPAPLILDVGTGTGRLPLTLFDQTTFNGYVVGLDYSRKMLAVGAENLVPIRTRVELIYQTAMDLPFADETFDAVTCLEALEFMPNPDAVLAEIVRVARPGAVIFLTNRKGVDAKLMPGKTQSQQAMITKLRDRFGLIDISTRIWQMDYDQVWAFKPGYLSPAPEHSLIAILRCPHCGQIALSERAGAAAQPAPLICTNCQTVIQKSADGVVEYAHHSA